MRIQVKHAHGRHFQVSLCGDFTELQELKQEIIQQTVSIFSAKCNFFCLL